MATKNLKKVRRTVMNEHCVRCKLKSRGRSERDIAGRAATEEDWK